MERRRTPDRDLPLKEAALRQVVRVAVILPSLVYLWAGQSWLRRTGGGCAEAQDDDLALIGLGGVAVGRLTAAGIAAAVGAILLFVGAATGLGCLR